MPDGIASTYLHELVEGDEVYFTGPYGEFRLSEDPDVEIVCVGGGCGMAPMRNIVFTIYDRWPDRSCWLFFGCRTTKGRLLPQRIPKRVAEKHPPTSTSSMRFQILWVMTKYGMAPRALFISRSTKHLALGIRRQAFLVRATAHDQRGDRSSHAKGSFVREDIFYDKF